MLGLSREWDQVWSPFSWLYQSGMDMLSCIVILRIDSRQAFLKYGG